MYSQPFRVNPFLIVNTSIETRPVSWTGKKEILGKEMQISHISSGFRACPFTVRFGETS